MGTMPAIQPQRSPADYIPATLPNTPNMSPVERFVNNVVNTGVIASSRIGHAIGGIQINTPQTTPIKPDVQNLNNPNFPSSTSLLGGTKVNNPLSQNFSYNSGVVGQIKGTTLPEGSDTQSNAAYQTWAKANNLPAGDDQRSQFDINKTRYSLINNSQTGLTDQAKGAISKLNVVPFVGSSENTYHSYYNGQNSDPYRISFNTLMNSGMAGSPEQALLHEELHGMDAAIPGQSGLGNSRGFYQALQKYAPQVANDMKGFTAGDYANQQAIRGDQALLPPSLMESPYQTPEQQQQQQLDTESFAQFGSELGASMYDKYPPEITKYYKKIFAQPSGFQFSARKK